MITKEERDGIKAGHDLKSRAAKEEEAAAFAAAVMASRERMQEALVFALSGAERLLRKTKAGDP